MPKLKSHRGAAKRFKVKKSGKVKGAHAHHSHMLTFSKNRDQKRNLQKTFHLADPDAAKIRKELLPYG